MKKLPVFGLTGSKSLGSVLIDDELYPELFHYRWVRSKKDSPVFRFVDGDKGPKKSLGHQILGKTPQNKYVIIHKDGNINNYCLENLEAQKRDDQ